MYIYLWTMHKKGDFYNISSSGKELEDTLFITLQY